MGVDTVTDALFEVEMLQRKFRNLALDWFPAFEDTRIDIIPNIVRLTGA